MSIETSGHTPTDRAELLSRTADIVSAYVSNNGVEGTALPSLISSVHAELAGLGKEPAEPEPVPAVPIKKSVTPAAITCLECGKKFKMLKRHLNTDHGQTPDDYRKRWNLGHDYPMVAPNYSLKRTELAVKIGLGRHPKRAKKA